MTSRGRKLAYVVIAICVLGFILMETGAISTVESWLATATGSTGNLLQGVQVKVVSDNSNTPLSTVNVYPQGSPLSILAGIGSQSIDITNMVNSATTKYFFEIMPQVTPTYTITGSPTSVAVDYTITYQSAQLGSGSYSMIYTADRMTNKASAVIVLPFTSTFTDSSPKSGSMAPLSTQTSDDMMAQITGITVPAAGTSQNLVVTVQISATLMVNGVAQNTVKQTGTLTISISNTATSSPSGTLSSVSMTLAVSELNGA